MGFDTIIQKLGEYSDNELYIKREDLIPVSFGGNKARKAVKFFQDIEKQQADCVVTYGSSSSNHCRVVSNMAASLNMPCYIISPKEASVPTFNSILMERFQAEIIVVPVADVHDSIEQCLARLKAEGKKPYFIGGGGHGNIGTEAYIECYNEICAYEKKENVHFDYIFHASGTGTTQAGLVCGQLINSDLRKIIGISIARRCPYGRDVVKNSIVEYLKDRVSDKEIEENLIFEDAYTGSGYGASQTEIKETINEIMIRYGIPLDETYTGKAFRGMKCYIQEKDIKKKKILFLHTGGTPLFFDYLKNESLI